MDQQIAIALNTHSSSSHANGATTASPIMPPSPFKSASPTNKCAMSAPPRTASKLLLWPEKEAKNWEGLLGRGEVYSSEQCSSRIREI